jgi:hypothetical protein
MIPALTLAKSAKSVSRATVIYLIAPLEQWVVVTLATVIVFGIGKRLRSKTQRFALSR